MEDQTRLEEDAGELTSMMECLQVHGEDRNVVDDILPSAPMHGNENPLTDTMTSTEVLRTIEALRDSSEASQYAGSGRLSRNRKPPNRYVP